MSDNRELILKGDVRRCLRALSLPMVVALLASGTFSVVGMWFVSDLGTAPLAAVGFCIPIMTLTTALFIALGIAGTSCVARALGAGEKDFVGQLAKAALLIGLGVSALWWVGIELSFDPLFVAMGATAEALPAIRHYMTPWLLGLPFMAVTYVGTAVLRGLGDTRSTATIMLGAALANVSLDPLLIFGWGPVPRFEVAGAGWASTIAYGVAFVATLRKLLASPGLLNSATLGLRRGAAEIGKIFVPALLARTLGPVGVLALTTIIAAHGADAVAAFGVGGNIQVLVLNVPLALSAGLSPLVGQNWAADQRARAREATVLACKLAGLWSACVWLLLAVAAPAVAGLFSESAGVRDTLVSFARIGMAGTPGAAIVTVAAGALNAIGSAKQASVLALLGGLGVVAPLALAGSHFAGVEGFFAGIVLGHSLTAVVAWRWLRTHDLAAAPELATASAGRLGEET